MKAIHWTIAATAFAFVQPTLASAATTDPEVIIYRFNGVRGLLGSAAPGTVFHCTNFSGANEMIRFVSRTQSGEIAGNHVLPISHLQTVTIVYGNIITYSVDLHLTLPSALTFQGSIAIAATSANMFCTAMVMETAEFAPVGIALRGIRFNPVPGSQE